MAKKVAPNPMLAYIRASLAAGIVESDRVSAKKAVRRADQLIRFALALPPFPVATNISKEA